MASNVIAEVKTLHNQMVFNISTEIFGESLEVVKELLTGRPLNSADMSGIKSIKSLFQRLMDYKTIDYGDYRKFVTAIWCIHPKMCSMVQEFAVKINKLKGNLDDQGRAVQPPTGAHNALTPARTAINLRDPGEGFHQRENHSVSYDHLESIISLNMKNSIGFIKVDDGCGTGFRVGDCYIMTAYHVFKDKFEFLCKRLTAMVENSSIKTKDTQQKLAGLSDQFSKDNGLNLTTCVKKFLEPNKKRLPFAALAGHLDTSFLEGIETGWRPTTSIAFNFGTKEELQFGFCLDIPFADKDNDILILKLRSDSQTRFPEPLHLEQFSVNNEMHLIGYLGTSDPAKSLHLNMNCQVYRDDRQLATDINKAMQWWKGNLPDASLDPCRYDPGKDETPIGRTILHASKEFEHRSSGCPAVVIEDYTTRRLVVQLMYQSGYPTSHYKTGKVHSPSLEYCFESGVSMKKIANILLEAGQDDLKNAIFS